MASIEERVMPQYEDGSLRKYAEQNEKLYEVDKPVRIIIVGAGNRGDVYALYALEHPSRANVVAIADPIKFRRERMAQQHNVPNEFVVATWEDIAALDKFADAVVITTPDNLHAGPAIAFANKGYHILVEKPMAISEADCLRMTKAAIDNNIIMAVGHVMRYTPYTQKIKEIIDSGVLGQIVNIQHLEPVGYWHAAHSYVRGNWSRERDSTFMLMAKSCHDIDWIRYVIGHRCLRVSSFGSLHHFRKEAKPKEAGDAKKCLDCPLKDTCPYSAKTVYLTAAERGHKGWPVSVIVTHKEPDIESVHEALMTGPYGRCVYECDNDVVDNQVVNMEFEGGRTSSFSMVAYSQDMCIRKTRIFGTHGQLEADGHTITLHNFRAEGMTSVIHPEAPPPTKMMGHQGADYYLMRNFVAAVGKDQPNLILSGPLDTLESHLIVFRAEQARREGKVVHVQKDMPIVN